MHKHFLFALIVLASCRTSKPDSTSGSKQWRLITVTSNPDAPVCMFKQPKPEYVYNGDTCYLYKDGLIKVFVKQLNAAGKR